MNDGFLHLTAPVSTMKVFAAITILAGATSIIAAPIPASELASGSTELDKRGGNSNGFGNANGFFNCNGDNNCNGFFNGNGAFKGDGVGLCNGFFMC